MYTYEQRMAAVKLYIESGYSVVAVTRELGYPTPPALRQWYAEYKECGDLHRGIRAPHFTEEQKQRAIQHYLENGKDARKTSKALGYPSRQTLAKWLEEECPDLKRHCASGGAMIEYPLEKKEQAVLALCTREGPAREVAKEHGVSATSIYKWRRQLLGKEEYIPMPKGPNASDLQKSIGDLSAENEELRLKYEELMQTVADLKKEAYYLRLECDALQMAAKMLKKAGGINLKTLRNREKAGVIDALREKYRLKDLLEAFAISKSSYCYQAKCLRIGDKYARLRREIHRIFEEAEGRYGYRRIHAMLQKAGTVVSEKVVRRIMKEESLVVRTIKRRKYNSYLGEISPAVPNVVNRNFHADEPNTKWLTDITEFSIPAGKVYLSPIIDCFDGLAVSWTIGTSPTAALVNGMLDEAISQLKEDEHPIVHSDRGGHYRWPGWIERMNAAGLTRSMSKKGCSPDNSACEGFFGRLKNEMFYGREWRGVSLDDFMETVDNYIHWYNEERIKETLGWMSPLEYRRSLGLAL